MKIVIPGGTGLCGRILTRHFERAGHDVIAMSRRTWNLDAIDGADIVINLAGRSVNCRYHERNKREIMESRVETTRAIGRAIAAAACPPALWMNASTATIYRHALDRPMDEVHGEIGGHEPDVPAAWHFSIDVATSWERAFFEVPTPHTRKVALRSAIVMTPDEHGVFAILAHLVRMRLGGAAGSGRQFVSWVHDVDFLRAIDFLIARREIEGVVNICSPNPLPNRDFMRAIREAYGIRLGLPARAWMLEIAAFFHRTETELLLKSRRVIPTRLLEAGFQFEFPEWPDAALELFRRYLLPNTKRRKDAVQNIVRRGGAGNRIERPQGSI